jgi:hypothetical protein
MASHEENGFYRILRLKGRNLKLISAGADSGKSFRATVNRIGEYILTGDVSRDPRGKFSMETKAAGVLIMNETNILQDMSNKEKYMLTEIGLACPDYSRKFLMMLGVPGKDSWA